MICTATRLNGLPCKANAVLDGDKCAHHREEGEKPRAPSKFDSETADRLVQLLNAGNYVAVAVRAAGISRALFYQWLDRGESDDPADVEYVDFRERVEHARAQSEARNVAAIANAARESWQAAAWLLERQYPDRWGRTSDRLRDLSEESEQIERNAVDAADPFSEVDQLAELRRRKGA